MCLYIGDFKAYYKLFKLSFDRNLVRKSVFYSKSICEYSLFEDTFSLKER